MNKTVYVLILALFFSCSHNRSPLVKGAITNTDGQESDVQLDMPGQGDEVALDNDWLIIGGKQVRNYGSDEKYYKKSDIENITDIDLYINPDDEERAAGFEGIEQLENLKGIRICLYGPSIDMLDYSPLNVLRNLEWLYFECPGTYKLAKPPDLSGITVKDSVTWIKFEECALTSMDNIASLSNLCSITVVAPDKKALTDIRAINQLKKLEYLEIVSSKSSIRMEDISALTELKSLRLSVKSVDAKGIEKLKSLETVMFHDGTGVINAGFLSGLSQCTYLDMTIKDIIPNTNFLAGMTSLQILCIDRSRDYSNGIAFPVFDLTPIGNLTQLDHLELCRFSLKNVAVLDELEQLDGDYDILFLGSVLYDESEKTTKHIVFIYDGR
jgi:hypothetical protein